MTLFAAAAVAAVAATNPAAPTNPRQIQDWGSCHQPQ